MTMADAEPPRFNPQLQSSTPSTTSAPSPLLLPVLPTPTDVPVGRPYTAATMASARTSFTHVDLEAPNPVPPLPTAGEESALSVAISAADSLRETSRELDLPQCSLTFLLVSGRRRAMSFEPETTIGRVKELVWNAWPSEWQDERPPSPSYLRVLYLGKILQDEDTLAKLSFPTTSSSPNNITLSPTNTNPPSTIVHLSIRPYAPASEEENLKKGRRRTWVSLGRRGGVNGISGGGREGTEGDEGSMDEVEGRREGGCCSGCIIS